LAKANLINESIKWHFAIQPGNMRENEQTQEEFFSNEETINEVSSLVRESIQNSLDERLDQDKPVKMVFTVGIKDGKIGKKYFNPLVPHISQVKELDIPDFSKPVKYLLIEDFNTLGLEGGVNSIARTDEELEKIERDLQSSADGYKESFWFFEWKSGGSNKKNGAKGSWGVGKIVFPRASGIKAYLVYSVRRKIASPDAETGLLFGHAIYNYRYVDGLRHSPDCQWMVRNPNRFQTADGKSNPFPSEDLKEHQNFISDWDLARKNQETGTSILIPYCNEAIKVKNLVECVIRDYFINILSGTLECEIRDTNGEIVVLKKDNLLTEIEKLSETLTTKNNKSGTELKNLCEMYLQKLEGKTIKHYVHTTPEINNDWLQFKLTSEDQEKLEASWISERVIELEVEVVIPETRDLKRNVLAADIDTFTILLQRVAEPVSSTVFCREGILIPNANNSSKLAECLSLVLIGKVAGFSEKKNSLANLLKWAEGPAHTTWSGTASKFKNRYTPQKSGESVIKWVKNSAQALYDDIRKVQDIFDETSLSDYAPDDSEIGIGILPPLSKSVVLKCQADKTNSRDLILYWILKNGLTQEKIRILEVSGGENEIFNGTLESNYRLGEVDLRRSFSYQVEVIEKGEKYLSNKVKIEAKVKTNDQIYVVDNIKGSQLDGFGILPLPGNNLKIGERILVTAAYASRSTTNWSSQDFILKNLMELSTISGLVLEPYGDEGVLLKIQDLDFRAYWSGFDLFRELVVSAVRI
jgi:hypothetical protein